MPLAAKLNKIIRQKKHQQVGALKKPDGTFTVSSKESYVLLMSEHFPDAVSLGTAISADPAPMRGRYTHPVLVDQPDWIDDRRLRDALHSFWKDKAAGPDGIKPVILLHATGNALRSNHRATLHAHSMAEIRNCFYNKTW